MQLPSHPGSSELQSISSGRRQRWTFSWERFPRGREGRYPRAEARWRLRPLREDCLRRLLKGWRADPSQKYNREVGSTVTPSLPLNRTERHRDRHSQPSLDTWAQEQSGCLEKTTSSPTSLPPDSHRNMQTPRRTAEMGAGADCCIICALKIHPDRSDPSGCLPRRRPCKIQRGARLRGQLGHRFPGSLWDWMLSYARNKCAAEKPVASVCRLWAVWG